MDSASVRANIRFGNLCILPTFFLLYQCLEAAAVILYLFQFSHIDKQACITAYQPMNLTDNRAVHLSLHDAVNAHQPAGAFQLERDRYRKGRPVNNLFTQQENLRQDKHNRENRENRSPAQTLSDAAHSAVR